MKKIILIISLFPFLNIFTNPKIYKNVEECKEFCKEFDEHSIKGRCKSQLKSKITSIKFENGHCQFCERNYKGKEVCKSEVEMRKEIVKK